MAQVILSKHLSPVLARLPKHYKERYVDSQRRKPLPVHFIPENGRFKKVEATGKVYPMEMFNIPPKVMYPKEADLGLWGGEGIVVGYRQRKAERPKHPRTWNPTLSMEIFYSEILDRWMKIIVTPRALAQMEEAGGFDMYILKTHQVDLKSRLGMHLKREMLLLLATNSLHPDNQEKREELMKKYQDFIIPEEEASWVGLTLMEAVRKQLKIEAVENAASVRPKKEEYLEDLLEGRMELPKKAETEKPGLFRRLFRSKDKDK